MPRLMNDRILFQAVKLWQMVSAEETFETYRQALAITRDLIKEAAILIWLTLCLALIGVDWLWTNSIAAGRYIHVWVSSCDQSSAKHMTSEIGKALLSASKIGVTFTISQARNQLSLPEKREPIIVSTGEPLSEDVTRITHQAAADNHQQDDYQDGRIQEPVTPSTGLASIDLPVRSVELREDKKHL